MLRHLSPSTRFLMWQCGYGGAITLLFLWATWLRFSLPLEPLADRDSWTYLSPAIRELIGAGFGHMPYGRNFVYPGFIYFLLRFFGDFRAITVGQHLLGLLGGGLMLVTWRRTRVFLSNPGVGPLGHDLLGLLAVASFLVAGGPIHYEMQLRPEALCIFVLSLNLCAVIHFGGLYFVEGRQRAAVVYGCMTVLSALVLADVKPSFLLVALVSLVPVGLFFLGTSSLWQKTLLGCGTAASMMLLLLPQYLFSRVDATSKWYLPTQLFAIHANLVRDQIKDDLETAGKLPYSRDWLTHVQSMLSNEIAKSGVHYSSLGVNPDYLMHNPNSVVAQLRKEFGKNFSELSQFYWFYYWRIWLHRPSLMLKKIARQFAVFYAPMCPAYSRERTWALTTEYRMSTNALTALHQREIWKLYQPAVLHMARMETLARDAAVVSRPASVRFALSVLAATYLTLFLFSLVLSAIVFLQESYRERLGGLAALVLFAYSYNVASCLEVALIHTLQNPRYVTVQVLFTILAQFLALWFVLEFILERRTRKKMRGFAAINA